MPFARVSDKNLDAFFFTLFCLILGLAFHLALGWLVGSMLIRSSFPESYRFLAAPAVIAVYLLFLLAAARFTRYRDRLALSSFLAACAPAVIFWVAAGIVLSLGGRIWDLALMLAAAAVAGGAALFSKNIFLWKKGLKSY